MTGVPVLSESIATPPSSGWRFPSSVRCPSGQMKTFKPCFRNPMTSRSSAAELFLSSCDTGTVPMARRNAPNGRNAKSLSHAINLRWAGKKA